MNILILIIGLIYTFVIGFLLVRYFLPTIKVQTGVGYSFGVGIGVIYLLMFTYAIIGMPWSIGGLLLPGLILIILLGKNAKLKLSKKRPTLLTTLLIVICLYVVFESISRPLLAWDGWATWLFRSKIFFFDNTIKPESLVYSGSDYPLVISLYSTFLYKLIGSVNDKLVLLAYPLFFISLVMIFYGSTKEYIGEKKALFFTILLALLQNLIRHGGYFESGMADLPLAYFFLMDFTLLLSFLRKPNLRSMLILQFVIGITALIKNEGVPFGIIMELVIIYTLIRNKYFKLIGLVGVFIFLYLSWEVYKNWYGIHLNDLLNRRTFDLIRLPEIAKGFVIEMLNIKNWNLLWFAFTLSAIATVKTWSRARFKIVYLFIFAQLLIYGYIFLITPIDVNVHIKNVVDRLFLHIAPLALFAIAMQFASNKHKSFTKAKTRG